jgi:competence protein ComEC
MAAMRPPRLAGLAVAFAGGVAVACGPAWAWWCGAAASLWLLRRWRGLRALAIVSLVGGALAAGEAATRALAQAAVAARVDDGVEDVIVGLAIGPVERDGGGGLRFAVELEAAGARVLVSVAAGDEASPEMAEVWPGDRVEVRGAMRRPRGVRVPGAPDASLWAAARGVVALVGAGPEDVRVLARAAAMTAWRPAGQLQRRMADRITAALAARDGGGVVRALVTADRGAMGEEDAARYRDTGTSHVLAVSGLHLAAIALLAFSLVRRAWARVTPLALRVDATRAAAAVAAPLAIVYTVVTGAPASAVRALLVVLIVLLGAALDRRARLIDALGAAAIAMLAVQPSLLWDASVQLSFAATVALGVAVDRGRPRPRRIAARAVRAAADLCRASLWTWAATAPVVAYHFGAIAPVGPIANLVAVPAVELVALPVGLAGALIGELWDGAAVLLLAVAAAVIARVGGALAHLAAWFPPVAVPRPDALELSLMAAVLLAAAGWARAREDRGAGRRARAALVVALAALAACCAWRETAPLRQDDLRATFLDVGQGDAAVIELPGGGAWLIDAGGLPFAPDTGGDAAAAQRLVESPGRDAVVRYLLHRRVRHIELAVLTHAHPDHYRGLAAVARAIDIDELWLARPDDEHPHPPELALLLDQLRARGTRVVSPPAGTVLERAGAALTVLAPEADGGAVADAPWRSANDNSIVLRIGFAGRRILLTGDLEEEGEADLLDRHAGAALAADLVKVGHHGSRTSSSPELVAAVRPRWAVISCGVQNRFGFPHADVVRRWQGAGARVLRTDQVGAVTLTVSPRGSMEVASVDPDPTAAE